MCSSDSCVDAAMAIGFSVWRLRWDTGDVDATWDDPSDFGTHLYRAKTHGKTAAVAAILKLNYTAFLVDPDIHFAGNPANSLTCNNCDLQGQQSNRQLNTGLYQASPTRGMVRLHEMALVDGRRRFMTQQMLMHALLEETQISGHQCKGNQELVRVKLLPNEVFTDGDHFYSLLKYPQNYTTQITLHNNFVTSLTLKEYRWRYAGFWCADVDGEFSRANENDYLIVQFPPMPDYLPPTERAIRSTRALSGAIGLAVLMGRILVLPKLVYDDSCDCMQPLLFCYSVSRLTWKKTAVWNYLTNPKTPVGLDWSISPAFVVESAAHNVSELVFADRSALLGTSPIQPTLLDYNNVAPENADTGWWGDVEIDISDLAARLQAEAGTYKIIRLAHLYHNLVGLQFNIGRKTSRPPLPTTRRPVLDTRHCIPEVSN